MDLVEIVPSQIGGDFKDPDACSCTVCDCVININLLSVNNTIVECLSF